MQEQQPEDLMLECLIAAIIMVESGGNDKAVGFDGKSYGPMQITDICREDVNRIAGTKYTREDCFNRQKSIEMFNIYVKNYATKKAVDRGVTQQDVARIWNGGPSGWHKECTVKYWEKVKTALNNMGSNK